MVKVPTSDMLLQSARGFARSAIASHHDGDPARVALYAGTALEHLAKACLASRAPALMLDLREEKQWLALPHALGLAEGPTPPFLTVGLRDAIDRLHSLGVPVRLSPDLQLLIRMRNNVAHAASDDVVEDRVVKAFLSLATSLLKDLHTTPEDFWGPSASTVESMLEDASSAFDARMSSKLAFARERYDERYGHMPVTTQDMIRSLPPHVDSDEMEEPATCPVCGSLGVATGQYDVEVAEDPDFDEDGTIAGIATWVVFQAESFLCRYCGLHLESSEELAASGMEASWEAGAVVAAEVLEGHFSDYYEDRY
ncbi:MAG: hypothetical protein ACYC3K_14800 [Candidatus Nanopelagicales bacterium]